MKYSIALTKHFDERERLFDLLINDEILINYNPVSIICMDINKVPDFLNNAINEIDYDVIDYSRISFGEYELDGEILVPEGMVGFSIFDDITLLSKNEFYSLCLQLGLKSIEAFERFDLMDRSITDSKWTEKMVKLIPEIEKKRSEALM